MEIVTKGVAGLLRSAFVPAFAGITLAAGLVHADTVVVPPANAAVTGNSSDATPLGDAANRGQAVYGTSLLGGLSVGDVITGVTFRVVGTGPAVAAQTVPNYEIRLSKSQNAPGSLSATFADNRGVDEVFVHTGALTIAAGDFPGGSSPNDFGAVINFTTPYTFQGGPLLMEYSHDPFPSGGQPADAASGIDAQSAFGTGFSATTANIGVFANYAPVVQFTTVPEPASVAALFATAVVMILRRRQ